jgi:hypothetical protein
LQLPFVEECIWQVAPSADAITPESDQTKRASAKILHVGIDLEQRLDVYTEFTRPPHCSTEASGQARRLSAGASGKQRKIGRDWASRLDDELGSALRTSNRTVHAALRVGCCGLGYAG